MSFIYEFHLTSLYHQTLIWTHTVGGNSRRQCSHVFICDIPRGLLVTSWSDRLPRRHAIRFVVLHLFCRLIPSVVCHGVHSALCVGESIGSCRFIRALDVYVHPASCFLVLWYHRQSHYVIHSSVTHNLLLDKILRYVYLSVISFVNTSLVFIHAAEEIPASQCRNYMLTLCCASSIRKWLRYHQFLRHFSPWRWWLCWMTRCLTR